MSQVILTKSFQKQIEKIKSVTQKKVIDEIEKYVSGLDVFIDVYSPAPNLKVLKGYLAGGKVRIVILLTLKQKQYIPFFLVKKESKRGWNISKQSEKFLENYIIKATQDIKDGNFEIFDI